MGAVSQSAARLVHLDVQKDTVTRSYRLTISHEIIFYDHFSSMFYRKTRQYITCREQKTLLTLNICRDDSFGLISR